MKPITVQITIDRAAAILAGLSQHGETVVEVDPGQLTADQRDELARITPPYGVDYLVVYGYTTPIVAPTLEAIAKALDEVRAKRLLGEERKAAYEAEEKARRTKTFTERAIAFVEKPVSGRISRGGVDNLYIEAEYLSPDLRAAYDKAVAEARAEVERLAEAAQERDRLAREAEAALAASKAKALEDWLAKHGTITQQKRRADRLMRDDEILDLVRNEVFAPLDHLPRYERMKASDWPNAHHVKFTVTDSKTVTDGQYETMEAMRKLLPGATVTARDHFAAIEHCDDDDDTDVRESYLVTIDWNGWKLSREYAA